MAWIQFDSNSPKAPSIRLPTMGGNRLAVSDFRQRANVCLLFVPAGCRGCRRFLEQSIRDPADLDYADARVLVEVSDAQIAKQMDVQSPYLHYLIDQEGKMAQQYSDLIDADAKGKVMLFILDRFGVPWAAWVGEEPDDRTWEEARDWLDYISIQCPE
jgi:peroxiredoxin